jgi:hypothetical protein
MQKLSLFSCCSFFLGGLSGPVLDKNPANNPALNLSDAHFANFWSLAIFKVGGLSGPVLDKNPANNPALNLSDAHFANFWSLAIFKGGRIIRSKLGPDYPALLFCNGYNPGRGINTPPLLQAWVSSFSLLSPSIVDLGKLAHLSIPPMILAYL